MPQVIGIVVSHALNILFPITMVVRMHYLVTLLKYIIFGFIFTHVLRILTIFTFLTYIFEKKAFPNVTCW